MSADETEGFVIRDRRGRTGDQAEAPSRDAPSAAQPGPGPASAGGDQAHQDSGHPVTFSSFVFSLGTSALMLMGEQLDPRQPKMPVNLAQAKEIIDILSVLEGKTKGNLTPEEQGVLEEMLYALRMKYVDLASGKQASASP